MAFLLFGALGLLVYTYFGYPAALALLSRRHKASPRAPGGEALAAKAAAPPPKVSILIAAYNEERWIGAKIANSLALSYPQDRLEIWIGSDGSADRTDAIVSAVTDPRVRLHRVEPRGGKAGVLNALAARATGEILVFSDANTLFAPDAIEALVKRFEDPAVGVACGEMTLYDPRRGPGSEDEEGLYWRYERWLKRREGEMGALIGANGGIYAMRAELFRPLPKDTIADDFVLSAGVLLAGKKAVYAEDARAKEETAGGTGKEFGRRARIGAGNFQALSRHPALLSPSRPAVAFAFFSHKLLRWLAPLFMAAALFANLALAARPAYMPLLGAQLAFYALAAVGRGRLGSIARYFVAMNAALAVGFWRFARNRQSVTWKRTARA
jgi:cellulose synthase/poly-beta-1,6-N-acetylglucosamine synthase-like glycosyltransferase